MSDIKKVVLAYSGGLDTSVILKWLQDTYQCEVVTFTADIGQGEELEPARAKAIKFEGNDQVRFELGYYALEPGIKVIAPWREWDLVSREKLLQYAEAAGIAIDMKHKQGGAPYSMDANLLHISFEGRHLEDPKAEAEESMWRWTVSPEAAPDKAEYLDIEFEHGDIVGLNGVRLSPAQVLTKVKRARWQTRHRTS
jgi:argininosuccinate synthase